MALGAVSGLTHGGLIRGWSNFFNCAGGGYVYGHGCNRGRFIGFRDRS
jgi:hypothetical protein